MSNLVNQTAELLATLPEDEILLVNSLVKKLVMAWDPDYTKMTPAERINLKEALSDQERILHDEINWD